MSVRKSHRRKGKKGGYSRVKRHAMKGRKSMATSASAPARKTKKGGASKDTKHSKKWVGSVKAKHI